MREIDFILSLLSIKGWGNNKVFKYISNSNFDLNECINKLDLILTKEELKEYKNNYINVCRDVDDNLNKDIKVITLFDKSFPSKLYKYSDPCLYLYYQGDIKLLSSKCITIIGTRHPKEYFIKEGVRISEYFASRGYTIVSGLAIGCDSIAHKVSLKYNGNTIAVLPSNLINILPRENVLLANKIKERGLLISEYSINHKTNKYDFIKRDRIQSLLSNVVIVIESNNTGGTMHCVRKSIKDNKLVYALGGNKINIINNYICKENDLKDIESYSK